MRRKIARALVHHVASAIDRAYIANFHEAWNVEQYWLDISLKREKLYLPLARKIHHDAAVDQMVSESWWG